MGRINICRHPNNANAHLLKEAIPLVLLSSNLDGQLSMFRNELDSLRMPARYAKRCKASVQWRHVLFHPDQWIDRKAIATRLPENHREYDLFPLPDGFILSTVKAWILLRSIGFKKNPGSTFPPVHYPRFFNLRQELPLWIQVPS